MASTGICHRKGCRAHGCDTYLMEMGFICNECQEEFKYLYVKICAKDNKVVNMYAALQEFMVFDKNPAKLDTSKLPQTVDNFFKNHKINIDGK